MNKTFTQKNVVKLNSKKQKPIKETMKIDECEPSTMVILNILNYSKALGIRTTRCLGKIDMLLN